MDLYYPPDYMPHAPDLGTTLIQRLGWPHGLEGYRRCRFVAGHKSGGSLLDVGCATGTFLASMRARGGWRVWGIEPDLSAARRARARGLDVAVAHFEDLRLTRDSLDAVTLWDVLEHLPDPLSALVQVRRALRSDGFLFLNVPVLDSLDASVFGPYWCGLDLPRHLTLFDRQTLALALSKAGLELVAQGYPTGSHYSFTASTRLWLEDHAPPRFYGPLRYLTYHSLTKAALLPWFWATAALGRSASLTVAARPRV